MLQELFRIPIPDFLRHLFPLLPSSLPLYGYGLMMVIGFLIAVEFGKFLAKHSGIDPEVLMNAALIALVTGIVGARLSHVIENWPQYSNPARGFWGNFGDAINISSGGLTFYGGLILATPFTILYAVYKKVPLKKGMDIAAPCILIGLGIGRVGCFLNGCCYGAQSDLPWAVRFPYHSPAYIDEAEQNQFRNVPRPLLLQWPNGQEILSVQQLKLIQATHDQLNIDGPAVLSSRLARQGGAFNDRTYRDAFIEHAQTYGGQNLLSLTKTQHSTWLHPSQLYSTITALLIAALLGAYFTTPHIPGRVFALMLILEGATRYLLEMLRVEPPVIWMFRYGFSLSMLIGLALVPAGVILWFVFGAITDKSEPRGFPVVAAGNA